jgi:hypothetical protein
MKKPEKIRCDACPVMCFIADGKIGACDRYANQGGKIIRCDPLTILDRRIEAGDEVKPFLKADWDGVKASGDDVFITAYWVWDHIPRLQTCALFGKPGN